MLQQHLSCAALEHPLSLLYDEKYFGPGLESAVMKLKNKGYLSTDVSRDYAARMWTYIGHEVIHMSGIFLLCRLIVLLDSVNAFYVLHRQLGLLQVSELLSDLKVVSNTLFLFRNFHQVLLALEP